MSTSRATWPRPSPLSSGGPVRLRRWREDDLPALVEALNDAEIARWMPFPAPFTETDGREFLARQVAASGSFAMTGENDALLGAVWVRDVGEGRGQIGYWTAALVRGRGVASEALRQLVDRAFELGYERLQLLVESANAASARVAENAGFRREGVMRGWMELRGSRADLIMYGLLPGDVPE
jgi:[ribosomal protein S5]-alanine N-acetyltransferase